MGYNEYISIIIEISKVDPSIGLSIAAHNSLATEHIHVFGNEDQKLKWLPKLATGEWLGAWGLTEPGTGSDAKGMSATAKKEGDHWVLNGTKNFITHGKSCDLAVVIFRNGEKGDSHGMTSFVIEKGTPGLTTGKKEEKLGIRASDTCELYFDNCEIPESNLIGNLGQGFSIAMKALGGGRIGIASQSVGLARAALDKTISYSREREQFGQLIAKFGAIQNKIADMATNIEAARLLVMQAAILKDQGKEYIKEDALRELLESDRIKNDILNYELDLWNN